MSAWDRHGAAAHATDLNVNANVHEMPVVTASPVPQGELVSVVIPFGSPPGSTVQITTPAGTTVRAEKIIICIYISHLFYFSELYNYYSVSSPSFDCEQ